MKDWKGNEIKAGDTIFFVKTKQMYKNPKLHIPTGLVNGQPTHRTIDLPEPPEHTWELGPEMEVICYCGRLYYSLKDGEPKYNFPLENPINDGRGRVVCIKGVSDSEEEYYKEFFKA